MSTVPPPGERDAGLSEPAAPGPARGSDPTVADPDRDPNVYAGPAVRRLARERGIDLRTVGASGRRGRILIEDLERASGDSTDASSAAGSDSLGLAPWPSVDFARYGDVERVPSREFRSLRREPRAQLDPNSARHP
jgi:pyruvate dehydrogenase E2 component (dihydrolipoamide acetyltransferase)